MRYRLLILELLFAIGCMVGMFASAYRWTNSALFSLVMAVGIFWVCVLVSWLAHRSVTSYGDDKAKCSSVVHFSRKYIRRQEKVLFNNRECDRK